MQTRMSPNTDTFHAVITTYNLLHIPHTAPICNLSPDLKFMSQVVISYARFKTSLPRFEIPAPICNLFAPI